MNYQEYLCHFNKNHDPRNGQFAPGKGVVGALQKLGYRQAHSKAGQFGVNAVKKAHEAKNARKKAVRDYKESYDRWQREQDALDVEDAQLRSQYKELGGNFISRARSVRDAQKGRGTDAAKKYIADFDKWTDRQDANDDLWMETKEKYIRTGRTWLTRILNNAKYGKHE